MKRFVPPLLNKSLSRTPSTEDPNAPPAKRQKLSWQLPRPSRQSSDSSTTSQRTVEPAPAAPTSAPGGVIRLPLNNKLRKPLLSLKMAVPTPNGDASKSTTPAGSGTAIASSTSGSKDGFYNVLWRKSTNKKHKTWDGDGVLEVSGGYATLQDVSGQNLGKTMMNKILQPGDELKVGNKEVEVDSVLSKQDFLAGRPFLKTTAASTGIENLPPVKPIIGNPGKSFKTPLLSSTVMPKKDPKVPTPRHDPEAENALIMSQPKKKPAGKSIVDVVVDPYLTQHLRPHQREGVKFLYETVMGMKAFEGHGAILADEMGLGKTLQTIALLWTLMKQNPIYGDPPIIKKALIVCPVTLIKNWRNEFRKWLGNERIGVFVADSSSNLRDFWMGKTYSVCVIGYEKLQKCHAELKKANIDIVIADEGHRLKTEKNKSALAIKALDTKRRVILSGTPLQNDLQEYWVMADFVNPNLLQSYSTFKKEFETPIVKSQQPEATQRDIEKGNARRSEFNRITSLFVLRRTAEILSAYLPPKKEYIIFCRPTLGQLELYREILDSSQLSKALGSMDASLALITKLKKLCNSSSLLNTPDSEHAHNSVSTTSLFDGGKLRVLGRLLKELSSTTDEKVVLVSNYTSTLDILEKLLSSKSLSFLRLDGSTPTEKRQGLVDTFNKSDAKRSFAFLLSAKSGGAGINLIGASRLVLFDLDWNPAIDAQAMARIHRDGQKREVKIYRMLTTGCMDEKIFQRQITKRGLAEAVMEKKGGSSGKSAFTQSELRDLFMIDEETECQTHDLLGCLCRGKGSLAEVVEIGDEKENKKKEWWEKKTGDTSSEEGFSSSDDDDDDLLLVPPPKASSSSSTSVSPHKKKYPGLKKASLVRDEDIEGKKAKNAGALGELMGYEHVSMKWFGGKSLDDEEKEAAVEDAVLRSVLMGKGEGGVSMVFQKSK